MQTPAWIHELFTAIDQKNTDRFLNFLTPDGSFRYGSQEAVEQKETIGVYLNQFFDAVETLSHEAHSVWHVEPGNIFFVEGRVSYLMKDGREATVPFLNKFEMVGDKIRSYNIYTDPTPLG